MRQVRLFGRFEAANDGVPFGRLEAGRVQELFSLLVLSRSSTINREVASDRMWPDIESRTSKKYLRQTLWQLQKAFDSDGDPGEVSVFKADCETIVLQLDTGIWVDVIEFERGFEASMGADPSDQLCPAVRDQLARAVRLYRGELLEGKYYDWLRDSRERYRTMYMTMLARLMDDAEAAGQWQTGLAYGRMALDNDRADERAHLHVMRCHSAAGHRTAALRQFESCRRALREELAVEPDVATTALYNQLQHAGAAGVVPPASLSRNTAAPPSEAATVDILDRLRLLSQTLAEVQADVADYLGDAG